MCTKFKGLGGVPPVRIIITPRLLKRGGVLLSPLLSVCMSVCMYVCMYMHTYQSPNLNCTRRRIDNIVEDNYGVGFEIYKGVKRAGWSAAWMTLKGIIKTFMKKQTIEAKSETTVTADIKPAAAGLGVGEDEAEGENEAAFITKMLTMIPSLMRGLFARL